MKKTLSTILLCTAIWVGNAQVTTPSASVPETSKTTVGLTEVSIDYSRPSKRGRVIFGNVVPYGELWRTGANSNTTIQFSDDVVIDGQEIEAGEYAIFTKPEKDHWEIYFYDETDNWGNQVNWEEDKVAAKAIVKVQPLKTTQETFSIALDNITSTSAMLTFAWDDVMTAVKFEVPSDKKAMATIEKTMKASPKAQDYLSAANYYYTTDRDIKQAKDWIDTGIKMLDVPAFYQLYAQALIHAKAGDKKSAMKIAERSLEASKKANDGAYVRMNEELMARLK